MKLRPAKLEVKMQRTSATAPSAAAMALLGCTSGCGAGAGGELTRAAPEVWPFAVREGAGAMEVLLRGEGYNMSGMHAECHEEGL